MVAAGGIAAASGRRTGIFGDRGGSPTIWLQISHECLLILDSNYQLFLHHRQPTPATPLPPPAMAMPLSDKVPTAQRCSGLAEGDDQGR